MKMITISPRGFGANTYVITKDGKTCLVIDPAQPRVEGELIKLGLQPVCVLLTHCHFDHAAGVPALQASGARVYTSAAEKPLVGTETDLASAFGAPTVRYTVDECFADNEEKTLAGLQVQMLWTAGHTAGSCCYLISDGDEKALFTGDTLFQDSIGRTDFPTGDIGAMRASLRRLKALQGDYPVYAGHNEPTTLDRERTYNPYLQDV